MIALRRDIMNVVVVVVSALFLREHEIEQTSILSRIESSNKSAAINVMTSSTLRSSSIVNAYNH